MTTLTLRVCLYTLILKGFMECEMMDVKADVIHSNLGQTRHEFI